MKKVIKKKLQNVYTNIWIPGLNNIIDFQKQNGCLRNSKHSFVLNKLKSFQIDKESSHVKVGLI